MQSKREVEKNESENQEVNETKQYFISNENFNLLKQYQQLIFEATEVSPALRKIVNQLITIENLEKVKTKFVSNLSH